MIGIIFGANGQDGYYLSKLLTKKSCQTIGVSRSGNWLSGDVSDFKLVEQLIRDYQPNYIFHLAANSTTKHEALFGNHHAIANGALNILEAVYRHSRHSKVFIVGSGIQFENTGQPISEKDNFKPSSPYAISRIYSVNLARYFRSLGIQTYVGYLFHHESPLRQVNHVSRNIIDSVKLIAMGGNKIIRLGDIAVEKEWTFAGDIVRGILTLVEQDGIYEATIGSGIGYSIREWLEICFDIIGKDWTKFVAIDAAFEPEYKRLISNPATIYSLGWKPIISIKELAKMMLFSSEVVSLIP
jgi:GDPmannose 4,6-dehydratase